MAAQRAQRPPASTLPPAPAPHHSTPAPPAPRRRARIPPGCRCRARRAADACLLPLQESNLPMTTPWLPPASLPCLCVELPRAPLSHLAAPCSRRLPSPRTPHPPNLIQFCLPPAYEPLPPHSPHPPLPAVAYSLSPLCTGAFLHHPGYTHPILFALHSLRASKGGAGTRRGPARCRPPRPALCLHRHSPRAPPARPLSPPYVLHPPVISAWES